MSKRPFKSQASRSRVQEASSSFGNLAIQADKQKNLLSLGASSSSLSYIYEAPNFDDVSDPQAVVAFKNLSKKDSITKVKALEDLLLLFSPDSDSKIEIDDGSLEVWSKLFPRSSIDNSPRVRCLTYELQSHISNSVGKRVAKYMSGMIGPWLAGFYDSDRSVSKSAALSLNSTFKTDAKIETVWRSYASHVLNFCKDSVSKESANTLSDPRTVRPDDADAKYDRVVSNCIAVVSKYIELAGENDSIHSDISKFSEFFQLEPLWASAVSKNSAVRRSVNRLTVKCVEHYPELLKPVLETISRYLITKALSIEQRGSNLEYSRALKALTRKFPSVWTNNYPGKKPVIGRLEIYLSKGSQNTVQEFWDNAASILSSLPDSALCQTAAEASAFAKHLRKGIAQKDEPEQNLEAAWNCYFVYLAQSSQVLKFQEPAEDYTRNEVSSMLLNYVDRSTQADIWRFSELRPSICGRCFDQLEIFQIENLENIVRDQFDPISSILIRGIESSFPSKATITADDERKLAQAASRWCELSSFLAECFESLANNVRTANINIVTAALSMLQKSRGESLASSLAIKSMIQLPQRISPLSDSQIHETFSVSVLHIDAETFQSLSAPILAECLLIFGKSPFNRHNEFLPAWIAWMSFLADSNPSDHRIAMSHSLLASIDSVLSQKIGQPPVITDMLKQSLHEGLSGNKDQWSIVDLVTQHPENIPAKELSKTFETLINCLASENPVESLRGLLLLAREKNVALRSHLYDNDSSELSFALLVLSDSLDPEVSSQAKSTTDIIDRWLLAEFDMLSVSSYFFGFQREAISTLRHPSVSVKEAISRAYSVFQMTPAPQRGKAVELLLPSPENWEEALQKLIKLRPKPSLSITSPLVVASNLTQTTEAQNVSESPPPLPEQDALFLSLQRESLYSYNFLQQTSFFSSLNERQQKKFLQNLILSIVLVGDKLSLDGFQKLHASIIEQQSEQSHGHLSDMIPPVSISILSEDSGNLLPLVNTLVSDLFSTLLEPISVVSNYKARGLVNLLSVVSTKAPGLLSNLWTDALDSSQEGRGILPLLTLIYGSDGPPSTDLQRLNRLLNKAMSDLAGSKSTKYDKSFLQNVLLVNAIGDRRQASIDEIPKQRVIFVFKTICSLLEDQRSSFEYPACSEALRLLRHLSPTIQELYGTHWEASIEVTKQVWRTLYSREDSDSQEELSSDLPLLHSSLQLYETLQSLRGANEDLEEVLSEAEEAVAESLLQLLLKQSTANNTSHDPYVKDELPATASHPREKCIALLCRLVRNLSDSQATYDSQYYALLTSYSGEIQLTAFTKLHNQIPKKQGEISVEAALSNIKVELPAELTSNVLEQPDLYELSDWTHGQPLHRPIQSYLLCWILIFDHFEGSSFKVRQDYIAAFELSKSTEKLFSFLCSILFPTRNDTGLPKFNPLKLKDIATFTFDNQIRQPVELFAILIHVYYLTLLYIPGLFKPYYLSVSSRSLSQAILSLTEKTISPILTVKEFKEVSQHYDKPENKEDDAFAIKLLPNAREIQASYLVEDQTMRISIELPSSWPLGQAKVVGINRVAVDEKKWLSWNRTVAGIIAFGNGGVVDGLEAWQKNVSGTLKGQTECAICYGVVSSEKELPTKRCRTCKHLFHGSCLYKWFKSSNSSSCPLCRNSFFVG